MASNKTILDEIKNSIQQIADREKISVERAFAAWYAINFFGISNDDAIDASSLDGGEDQNIDFLYTDNLNERVIVLQAHCPKNTDNAAPKAKWDGIVCFGSA